MKLASATFLALTSIASAQNASNIISIPYEYTYLLPDGWSFNPNYTFVNSTSVPTNSTTPYNTSTDSSINSLLSTAATKPFISYDDSFLDILEPNPTPELVAQASTFEFYEAAVWVPERNEVWFSTSAQQNSEIPGYVSVYSLETNSTYRLNGTKGGEVMYPNGGYYFKGKVYFTTFASNTTYRGGIVSVNVTSLEVETVLNSYFGLPFDGIDDLVWVKQGNKKYLYFSDFYYVNSAYPNITTADSIPVKRPSLPAGVWRYDPQEGTVLQVIGRNEIEPNGIRVSPDQRYLYVTDNGNIQYGILNYAPPTGSGSVSWTGPYIYRYELDEEMYPTNRRLFGTVRLGIADGLHVDDDGNVWSAEYEGVVVRSPKGKILGVFNAEFFGAGFGKGGTPSAQFALAGDTFVYGDVERVWIVKLGREVVSRGSVIAN
ncbi:calcium-dependent phosphotriesterase [Teratosphaeria nubilosa]|uniref:Calcium-dependent phosphotriesterase n=1 Tax=Teratosphaeria nubilosa TaxID=161662 RepID=A0A6G1KWG2_9PEZI|nr:calcium-dependent phosphotriesterase [Teratosphaeria nubilosa]